jgi:hypothetical protein
MNAATYPDGQVPRPYPRPPGPSSRSPGEVVVILAAQHHPAFI